MVYLSEDPQGDLTPKWQGPFRIILLIPPAATLKKVASWVYLSRIKRVAANPVLPSLTDAYQVSLTGPTSLKITRRQPLSIIQEDTEWPGHSSTYSCSWHDYYKTSGPAPWQKLSRMDLTTLVSELWLKGTFYNLTLDKIYFLYSRPLHHSTSNSSSPDSSYHKFGAFRLSPDWPLPIPLAITALLTLALAIGLTTVSPLDWSSILRLCQCHVHCQGSISSSLSNYQTHDSPVPYSCYTPRPSG